MLKKIRVLLKQKRIKKQTQSFERSLASCGKKLFLLGKPVIYSPEKLHIGNNCKLNDNVYINARSGVTIGDNVTVSYGAKIISTGYDIDKFMETGERIHITDKPIFIGNYCWICAGATILPGVKITGEKVVVAADSIVTKDITESKVVVAGNPAKIVKRY